MLVEKSKKKLIQKNLKLNNTMKKPLNKIISLSLITSLGVLMTFCSDNNTATTEKTIENTGEKIEEKAITAKDSLKSKLRSGIVAIDQKLDILEEKMEVTGDQIDERAAASKQTLEEFKVNLEVQLEKIEESTEDNWEEVETNANNTWNNFTENMKQLETEVKDLFTKKQ